VTTTVSYWSDSPAFRDFVPKLRFPNCFNIPSLDEFGMSRNLVIYRSIALFFCVVGKRLFPLLGLFLLPNPFDPFSNLTFLSRSFGRGVALLLYARPFFFQYGGHQFLMPPVVPARFSPSQFFLTNLSSFFPPSRPNGSWSPALNTPFPLYLSAFLQRKMVICAFLSFSGTSFPLIPPPNSGSCSFFHSRMAGVSLEKSCAIRFAVFLSFPFSISFSFR